MREIGTSTKHDYTNAQMVTKTTASAKNIIDDLDEVFTLKDDKTIYRNNSRYTYELDWIGENTNAAKRLVY